MGFVKDAWNGITGKTGAKAAEKAGNLQADSSAYAADLAQKQFEQTRQDQMPWLNAGKGALGQLQGHIANDKGYNDQFGGAINQGIAGLNGNQVGGNNFDAFQSQAGQAQAGQAQGGQANAFNGQSFGNIGVNSFNDSTRKNIQNNYNSGQYTGGMSAAEFETDPSYEFRKQQGMDGLQSSAAASGGLLSGAALKALNSHNSNLASQEYGNAWQRDQAQKQQHFAVDSNIRNQDFSIFADGANRKFAADSANAQMNQNNSQFNANQNQNNSQYNANQFQQNSQYNAQLGQQNSQFNANQNQQNSQFNANQQQSAASTNAQLNQNAQSINQTYGLNSLAAMLNARSQDYGLFSNEDTRKYNQYANLAGVGQTTANNLGTFGSNNAVNQGDAAIAGANAQANGITAGAAAQSAGWGNLLGLGSMALGGFGMPKATLGGSAPAALY